MKFHKMINGIYVPDDIKNRRGKFEIDTSLVEADWDAMARVMRNVVVIRAECLLHRHSVEYVGVSPYFDPCENYQACPLYTPVIHMNNHRIVKVEWQKTEATSSPKSFGPVGLQVAPLST